MIMGVDTDLPQLVEEHSIARGVRCLLYRADDNPTVAVHGSIRTGSAIEPRNLQGIAELATRLLIRGSKKLGPEKIADSLESIGAAISFRNTPDAMTFQARMTTPWTQRVLNILAECLTNPSFDRRDVEKEKEELLTDIRLRDDDPTRRGIRELLQLVYPKNHPYGQDKFGTAESVKKIERATLVDFFHDNVAKAPVILAFAGQFKPDQALKWSGRTFGEREDSSRLKTFPGTGSNPTRKEIVMAHKAQTEILMGTLAVDRLDPDYEP